MSKNYLIYIFLTLIFLVSIDVAGLQVLNISSQAGPVYARSNNESGQMAMVQIQTRQTSATATVTDTLPTQIPLVVVQTTTPEPRESPKAKPTQSQPSTALPASDYRLGYVEGRPECTLATEIVATLMRDWGWQVETIPVADATALFQGVAHVKVPEEAWVDLSLCYHDPEDRALFYKYGGRMLIIGDGYAQIDGDVESDDTQLSMLAYVSFPSTLRYRNNCLWTFIKNLDFEDAQLTGSDALTWIDAHPEQVAAWGTCKDSG